MHIRTGQRRSRRVRQQDIICPEVRPRRPAGVFFIDATVTNTGARTFHGPIDFVVHTLTGDNLLLSRSAGDGGVGRRLRVASVATGLPGSIFTFAEGDAVSVSLAVGL